MHLNQAGKLLKKSDGVIISVSEAVQLTNLRTNGAKLIKTVVVANIVANGFGEKSKLKKLSVAAMFGRLKHDLPLSQLWLVQQLR
nr:MAG TPA: hypothetical protein [Caudoviricetes sp.]